MIGASLLLLALTADAPPSAAATAAPGQTAPVPLVMELPGESTATPHRKVAPAVRLGLLLVEGAAGFRVPTVAPSLRLQAWPTERLMVDGGWQLAWVDEGSGPLGVSRLMQSLDARLHAVWKTAHVRLTAGAGLAGHLVISKTTFPGGSSPSALGLAWGVPVAVGVETRVDNFEVRVEAGVVTRGLRVDWLGGAQVAF